MRRRRQSSQGIAAKAAAEPVGALDGDSLHLGDAFSTNNRFTLPTGILYNGPTLTAPNNSIFMVADHVSPLNEGNTVGVIAGAATSAVPNGVYGFTSVNNGAGVIGVGGTTTAGQSATGVQGTSSGNGSAVLGQSGGTGPGVSGGRAAGNSNNVNGVEGYGGGTSSGVVGIGGLSNGSGLFAAGGGTTGTGVVGVAANGAPSNPARCVRASTATHRAPVRGPASGASATTSAHAAMRRTATASGCSAPPIPSRCPSRAQLAYSVVRMHLMVSGHGGEALNGVGAYGHSNASSGVAGLSSTGSGVYGLSASGVGVTGTTTTGLYGIVGYSGSSQGSAGLLGVANGPNAVGFGTVTAGGATFAGYFNGTTVVNGAFAVTGSKSAAVKDAAGDYRLMYSEESPEAWLRRTENSRAGRRGQGVGYSSATDMRVTVKVLPTPTALARLIAPPMRATSCRATARPTPAPGCAGTPSLSTRSNGSKMRAACSGAMPMPVSRTAIDTAPPSTRAPSVTVPPDGVNL